MIAHVQKKGMPGKQAWVKVSGPHLFHMLCRLSVKLIRSVSISLTRDIPSSTANATLYLNIHNNLRFHSIHLLFGIDVAKPFAKNPCENQTWDLLRSP